MGRDLQPKTSKATTQKHGVRVFLWVGVGVGAFHLGLFLVSCILLLTQATAVESQFTQDAVKNHGSYMLWSSLSLLRGYAIISFAYLLVLYPAVLWWMRRRRAVRWAIVWRTLLLTALCVTLLFVRLMALRPYFVTQWLPDWQFQIVPGSPSLLQQILVWTLANGLPLALLAVVGVFWLRRLGRLLQEGLSSDHRRAVIGTSAAAIALIVFIPFATRAKGGAADANRPNIIIIASDSLRADHLSCNGYGRETSPHIDALAARSINFSRAYTPVGSTLESMVSMLSSQYPHTHGLRNMFPSQEEVETANRDTPKLPEILGDAGYETAVIGDWCGAIFNEVPMGFASVQVSQFDSFRIWLSQALYLSHPVMPLYFDNEFGYWLFPKLQSFAHYLRPEVIAERTIEKLDERNDPNRPFFYTVFTGCTHFAYHAPYPYYQKWSDPKYRGPNKYQVYFDAAAFVTDTEWDRSYDQLAPAEKQHIIDLYDGCVSRFDDCVGRILDALEKRGLMENTIVLITSDHGEDLFEPGATLTHGVSFNGGDQGNRIPCILHVPNAEPREVKELVRNIDFAPTLLSLVGLKAEPEFEGIDLSQWIAGSERTSDLALYGETGFPFVRRHIPGETTLEVPPLDTLTFVDDSFDYHIVARPEFREAINLSKERCLQTREWKLVFTPGAAGPIHRLYYLPEDPYCERDVSDAHPEVFAKMRTRLWEWMLEGNEARESEILSSEPPRGLEIPAKYREFSWPLPES